MIPTLVEERHRHARPTSVAGRFRISAQILRSAIAGSAFISGLALGSCSYVERGRQIADFAVATAHEANLAALVEAQEERIRLRKSRCYNPMLTPATIADAALDPRLGSPWVEELLQDCPKFAAFLAHLVVNRAQTAGLPSPPSAVPMATPSPAPTENSPETP
ncbi:MAG: hypothetical protein U1E66_12785 [Rhodospirillales bacterium]